MSLNILCLFTFGYLQVTTQLQNYIEDSEPVVDGSRNAMVCCTVSNKNKLKVQQN